MCPLLSENSQYWPEKGGMGVSEAKANLAIFRPDRLKDGIEDSEGLYLSLFGAETGYRAGDLGSGTFVRVLLRTRMQRPWKVLKLDVPRNLLK